MLILIANPCHSASLELNIIQKIFQSAAIYLSVRLSLPPGAFYIFERSSSFHGFQFVSGNKYNHRVSNLKSDKKSQLITVSFCLPLQDRAQIKDLRGREGNDETARDELDSTELGEGGRSL